MMAIERIGSGLTAQTGMVGPMATLLMGVLILGEPFNIWIVGGTVLVLSGVFLGDTHPQSLNHQGDPKWT